MEKSLIKKIEFYQHLSGNKIDSTMDASEEFRFFNTWLKEAVEDEIELDDIAEVMLLDYSDFDDYIEHLKYEEPPCTCSMGCMSCLGMVSGDFF